MASKMVLKCNECEKEFKVSANNSDPQCPKCNGVDFEVLGITVAKPKRTSNSWDGNPFQAFAGAQ